jgi:ribosomal protein L33
MKIIPPLQLDVVIPSKNLAIEYNGVYWHSNLPAGTPKDYHLNKTKLCQEKGIQLIHIFENEWLYKRDIVKSIIKSKLGVYKKVVYARKCEVKELSNQEYREFVNLNHIQGYAPSKIRLGLFYNNELVSCIGVGNSRFNRSEMELIRFCNKLNISVVGGLSKLIKHSGIDNLISYVDLRYFDGSGYQKAGFKLVSQSKSGYFYISKKDGSILTRLQCQKHKLSKLLGDKFDSSLTEEENMILAGYYKIYDCGMLKFKLSSKSNNDIY